MKPTKTVGVYDRPPPKRWPKILAIAVAVLIGVIVTVLMMDRARADTSAVGFLERGAHFHLLALAAEPGSTPTTATPLTPDRHPADADHA